MSTEAFLDSRFAALPHLIADATNPKNSAADVRRFTDALLNADPSLFSSAFEFLAREGHGFVPVRPTAELGARTWPRWPLRRLFASRRPSLITNPVSAERALAVPFVVGHERYVVVALLRNRTLDAAQQAFLETLQSVTASAAVWPHTSERMPRFMWLGTDVQLVERIASLLDRRGWPRLQVQTVGEALFAFKRDEADIALLEASVLNGELYALLALRQAAKIGDAPIVYFVDPDVGSEVRTLVDYVLSPLAGETELWGVLKSSAAQVSRMRSEALRGSVLVMERQLRSCGDYPEVADTCADDALRLGANVVSVMLADDSGGVHAAHVPFQSGLGDHWPTPFLTGQPVLYTHADDGFFAEAFDDADFAQRVRELHPVSGAALAIAHGRRIVGTMLALSTREPMFQPEFDALTDLCECTGRIVTHMREPRSRAGPWRRVMLQDAMLEVFEGERARSSVCARRNANKVAIVVIEPRDDKAAAEIAEDLLIEAQMNLHEFEKQLKDEFTGVLLAVLHEGNTLHFACEGVPPPVRVPLAGPVLTPFAPQSCVTGAIALDAYSATLLYSTEFGVQVQISDLVRLVQSGLRVSRAGVARSLPDFAEKREKLSFACITLLSGEESI